MKSIAIAMSFAVFAFSASIVPASANAPSAATAKSAQPVMSRARPAQANCSYTYRRECNGYCWVCY